MLNRIESRSRLGSGGRDIGETDAMGLHIHVAVVDHDPGTGGPLADALVAYGCRVFNAEPGGTAESLLARAREALK